MKLKLNQAQIESHLRAILADKLSDLKLPDQLHARNGDNGVVIEGYLPFGKEFGESVAITISQEAIAACLRQAFSRCGCSEVKLSWRPMTGNPADPGLCIEADLILKTHFACPV